MPDAHQWNHVVAGKLGRGQRTALMGRSSSDVSGLQIKVFHASLVKSKKKRGGKGKIAALRTSAICLVLSFLLTCAASAVGRGGEDICQRQGVNSEEPHRHLSGTIDFHTAKQTRTLCLRHPRIGPVQKEALGSNHEVTKISTKSDLPEQQRVGQTTQT